jgi:hypothetical protein
MSIGLLVIYTLLIGLLEIQFGFTVGQVVQNLIRILTGGS